MSILSKNWLKRILFSSQISEFLVNWSVIRNFCRRRNFDHTRNPNSSFSKFLDPPQNRGVSKIYLHCRSNFETPLFWEVQKFWKPPIWGGPILKNWNLNFEYDRKFDVDRNFEQNFDWLKILKFASWKGYVSAKFWKGTPFFRGRREIFDFSEKI